MSEKLSLGELIRRQRAALDLTQARLADLVGRSPSTVRSWERDRSHPADEASLAALGAVLGLTDEELAGAAGTQPVPAAEESGVNLPIVDTDGPSDEPGTDPVETEPQTVPDEPTGESAAPVEPSDPSVETEAPALTESLPPLSPPQPEPGDSLTATSPSVAPEKTEIATGVEAPVGAVLVRPRVPSYLDDPRELRTYRSRAIMTAILLILMFIVLSWAFTEARDAFGLLFDGPVP